MKKLGKALLAGALVLSLSATAALADYNKGYKYYNKYVKAKAGIKGTDFLKLVGIKSPEDVDALFKDGGKPLVEKLEKLGKKKAAKYIKKILKKHAKDLEDFLKGMAAGKIPAGC
jgi:hypothetical protein